MSRELPRFRYFPDPVADGVFERSDAVCAACERPRGYLFRCAGCGVHLTPWDAD